MTAMTLILLGWLLHYPELIVRGDKGEIESVQYR